MIHYEKEFLSSDLISSYGLCRSIIVNSKNEVICYAPPKSIPADSFMEKYSIRNLFVVAEEFVEGTMINVFWDKTNGINGTWEIATRNIVGATSSFFIKKNRKSFREMFFEACEECNLLLDELNKTKIIANFRILKRTKTSIIKEENLLKIDNLLLPIYNKYENESILKFFSK